MPDTWVPCGSVGSNALLLDASRTGPGNTFATITFGVVSLVSPFGKPGGYEKPAGLRNGLDESTPVSTTAILMPSPFCPVAASRSVAWITLGPRSIVAVYDRLG